jgi:hypothetical protein
MFMNKKKPGYFTVHDANVWPYEIRTARSLARVGYTIDFYPKPNQKYHRAADVYMNNELCEFKAPDGAKMGAVERNLKSALGQSHKIVFDSRRFHKIPDTAIERELRSRAAKNKKIERLIFVNRRGDVIDIK